MNSYIIRDRYLNQLIDRKENGLIKVITGIRRCGKSFLLFNIFYDYLIDTGVQPEQIITIALDDDAYIDYRDPDKLSAYIRNKITDTKKMYYVLIDEVQYAISKEELENPENIKLYNVLNGIQRLRNVDIYVTGSNSKMLSKDVRTIFRGRGDSVQIYPLSFMEYYSYVGGDKSEAYEQYALFGGMPLVLSKKNDDDKFTYLYNLFEEVYFKDIIERYKIKHPQILTELTDDLCSSVGSLTNASKIANTLKSVKGIKVDSQTIANYLSFLEESFMFKCAKRYDVKGKKFFDYPNKYYCADIGLRNVRLNLRQQEETHIMENIIYNELIRRGYSVDVGVVGITSKGEDGKKHKVSCEIDFVANKGSKRYYIQSVLAAQNEEKMKTEKRSLLGTHDAFKKIIVTKTSAKPWYDDDGIIHIGLYEFLLNENSLDL